MGNSECPECEALLPIIPMEALHAGVLECEECGKSITWRSEAGGTEVELV